MADDTKGGLVPPKAGSPLSDKLEEIGVEVTARHVELRKDDAGWMHDAWSCTVLYDGNKLSSPFKTGTGHRKPAPGVRVDADGLWRKFAPGGKVLTPGYRADAALDEGMTVPAPPSAADVVSCLVSDAAGAASTFEEWASDLGYSADSRKALDVYLTCQKTREALVRLFGCALLDELASLEH